MRLPPTPCRVCFRPCVFNKFSHLSQKKCEVTGNESAASARRAAPWRAWRTRLSTVLIRQPRCCTSLWLMLPGHTWKGCTWRPAPMRHRSYSTGWTSTELAMI